MVNLNKDEILKELDIIENEVKSGELAQLDFVKMLQDNKAEAAKVQLKNYSNVAVFATGASFVASKIFSDFFDINSTVDFFFNCDKHQITDFLHNKLNSNTAIVFISKSGNKSLEINAYWKFFSKYYTENKLTNDIFFLSANKDHIENTTKELHYQFVQLPEISGRYAILSPSGFFPIHIMNKNIDNVYIGAQKKLDAIFANKDAYCSNLSKMLKDISNSKAHVLTSYNTKLHGISLWYRQVWMESLGKTKDIQPIIYNECPMDNHSQSQFWLGTSQNNYFSFFHKSSDDTTDPLFSLPDKIFKLHLKAMKDLNLNFTALNIENLNDIGELICISMLEIIILCRLLNINPFNQPAVEALKQL